MSNPYKTLLFSNLVFNDGFNLTVRRGRKWALEGKANIQLGKGVGEFLPGVTIQTREARFSSLTNNDVHMEHDPACRTIAGLLAEMQRVYEGFDVNEIVTLVVFYLDLSPPQVGDGVYEMDMGGPFRSTQIKEVKDLGNHLYMCYTNHTFRQPTTGKTVTSFLTHAAYRQQTQEINGWFP